MAVQSRNLYLATVNPCCSPQNSNVDQCPLYSFEDISQMYKEYHPLIEVFSGKIHKFSHICKTPLLSTNRNNAAKSFKNDSKLDMFSNSAAMLQLNELSNHSFKLRPSQLTRVEGKNGGA